MDHHDAVSRARTFRRLHQDERPLLLPTVWDALSARVFEQAGFPALATSSAAVAWSLGYRDGGELPREALLAAVARISRVLQAPLSVDLEDGFGDTPAAVAETVAAVIRAGAVGVNLEDGRYDAAGRFSLRGADEMRARLQAARAAAAALEVPIFINARSDLFLHGEGPAEARFDETLARARLYLDSGADGVFPIGLTDPALLARLCGAVPAPVNAAAMPGLPGLSELAALGVARVSTAIGPALVAMQALKQTAAALHDAGDLSALRTPLGYADAQALFAPRG
ncbi:isocitrate lyase/phosphoenolpyruvate mutase family protein [Chromobacterium violaceum]|uniref:isocitrate lyase/PEP mutase family protein n=1 Tax=Chromobacterium violaceum TaxID=536 RepID=UPI001BE9DA5F|nr:isocitrate lyase/phosphoenolpyruvate mutase family protein [Chromobacterium violaceum]MBT2869716.1 isocitrate lyase/phosphoenolpyruvate mutase family protein [Chromobacterium violaceum]